MDLKTIELEILKLNEVFIDYIDKVYQESDESLEEFLENLNSKVDDKSTFLKTLEDKIKEADLKFQEVLNKYTSEIEELMKVEKPLKYNLEEAALEIDKQLNEELKPFLLQLKKKKTELTHKITAQKKELSFLHKDNNTKLLDEEKAFKNREIELTRRMGIDLDRLSEANIKQYSDIEKSILQMEDAKLIREAQKKINAIRKVGIKDILAIKNKYAELNYKNAIEFKKFEDKIKLDNQVLTEEFKQRIKNLENEKELVQDEEDLKLILGEFEKELKLLEFHKENELDLIEYENTRSENIYNLKLEFNSKKIEDNKFKYESLKNVNEEIFNFDNTQFSEFILGNNALIESQRKVTDYLVDTLKNYILSFKDLLIISYEDYNVKREHVINSLKYILSSNRFDILYGSNTSYSSIITELEEIIKGYLKTMNNSLGKFHNVIKTMIKNLEEQLNLILISFKEFRTESDEASKSFYSSFKGHLNNGYKLTDLKITTQYHKKDGVVNTDSLNSKDDYNKTILSNKEKTKNIISEYNIKKKDILQKITNYKRDLKLKQDKDKSDLDRFVKQSKFKISNYKKIYAEAIIGYEKAELKVYKEQLKQNKIEYKNRLESIN